MSLYKHPCSKSIVEFNQARLGNDSTKIEYKLSNLRPYAWRLRYNPNILSNGDDDDGYNGRGGGHTYDTHSEEENDYEDEEQSKLNIIWSDNDLLEAYNYFDES